MNVRDQSWSDFIRFGKGRSAAKLNESIKKNELIEIKDSKFSNDPIVLMRKSDWQQMEHNIKAYKIAFDTAKQMHINLMEFKTGKG